MPVSANILEVFGAGFEVIGDALLGKAPFLVLFALIFLKPLERSLTLGSGNSGGVFALSLFAGAALAGQNLSDISRLEDSLAASIQRSERLIIPHGKNVFEAGDQVIVITHREDEEVIRAMAKRSENAKPQKK